MHMSLCRMAMLGPSSIRTSRPPSQAPNAPHLTHTAMWTPRRTRAGPAGISHSRYYCRARGGGQQTKVHNSPGPSSRKQMALSRPSSLRPGPSSLRPGRRLGRLGPCPPTARATPLAAGRGGGSTERGERLECTSILACDSPAACVRAMDNILDASCALRCRRAGRRW